MNDNTDSPGTAPGSASSRHQRSANSSLHPDYQEPVVGLPGFPSPLVVPGQVVRITDLPAVPQPLRAIPQPVRYQPVEPWPRERQRGLLRRFVDDPSWLLFPLAVAIPGTALGVLIWGIVGLATSPPVTVVSVILTIALTLWVLHKLRPGRSHQCQGLHCPGCRGDQ